MTSLEKIEELAERGALRIWKRDATWHVVFETAGSSYVLSGASLGAVLSGLLTMVGIDEGDDAPQ